VRVLGENNSCRQHYLYNCNVSLMRTRIRKTKSMAKSLVAIISGKWRKQLRLNLLLRRNKCSAISQVNKINENKICSYKWIMKIHIVPEEYKSQHMEIKSHTKYQSLRYIHSWMNIQVSGRACPRRNIVIEWLYSE